MWKTEFTNNEFAGIFRAKEISKQHVEDIPGLLTVKYEKKETEGSTIKQKGVNTG